MSLLVTEEFWVADGKKGTRFYIDCIVATE